MAHEAGPEVLRLDLPQLLDADAVFLVVAALVQAETLDHLLGERAARSFAEDRVLGAQLHAAGEVGVGLAVAADAHVAGGDADHLAVLDQHLGRREAGIDLDAELFRLAAEIAGDVAERADEIAVVVHELGHEQVGHLHAAGVSQIHELVGGDFRLERPVGIGAPFRQQAVEADGVDHRAGEDVGADLRAFLDHDHGDLRSRLGRLLLEADGGGQACGTRAHDDDVELHRFTGGQIGHLNLQKLKDFK